MPGYNTSSEALQALTNLRTQLQGFVLMPEEIYATQMQLLATLADKNFKKPSVFQGGSLFENVFTYLAAQGASSTIAQFWSSWITNIYVIPLLDADAVRITVQCNAPTSSIFNGVIFALSPNDATNQIPLDQFALLGNQASFEAGATASNFYFDQEIPCSGNRYIHLGGFIGGFDLSNALAVPVSTISVVVTYQLIK